MLFEKLFKHPAGFVPCAFFIQFGVNPLCHSANIFYEPQCGQRVLSVSWTVHKSSP